MHDYLYWADHLKSARDGYSRPVGNNRRIHWAGGDSKYGDDIALRYHATDVLVWHSDGTYDVAPHGWHTVTTKQTISAFSNAQLFSDKGTWYIRIEPDPNDPEPSVPYRAVPDPKEYTQTAPDSLGVHECGRLAKERSYQWCSICSRHEYATSSYTAFLKYVEEYGSLEAWREALKAARAERRAALKIYRAWDARNRVQLGHSLTVNADGYYPRKAAAKLRKAAAKLLKAAAKAEALRARERARTAKAEARRQKAIAVTRKRTDKLLSDLGIDCPPDVRNWITATGVEITPNGYARLCKVVKPLGRSNHGQPYLPGYLSVATDFVPSNGCGNGLHFSPSLAEAKGYHGHGPYRALECHVPLAGIVPIGTDKCKAERCKVIGPWRGR